MTPKTSSHLTTNEQLANMGNRQGSCRGGGRSREQQATPPRQHTHSPTTDLLLVSHMLDADSWEIRRRPKCIPEARPRINFHLLAPFLAVLTLALLEDATHDRAGAIFESAVHDVYERVARKGKAAP